MDNFALDLIGLDVDDYSDIDNLFGRLETIEPPVDMVDRIMSAVSRIPLVQQPAVDDEQGLDGVVINEAIA